MLKMLSRLEIFWSLAHKKSGGRKYRLVIKRYLGSLHRRLEKRIVGTQNRIQQETTHVQILVVCNLTCYSLLWQHIYEGKTCLKVKSKAVIINEENLSFNNEPELRSKKGVGTDQKSHWWSMWWSPVKSVKFAMITIILCSSAHHWHISNFERIWGGLGRWQSTGAVNLPNSVFPQIS